MREPEEEVQTLENPMNVMDTFTFDSDLEYGSSNRPSGSGVVSRGSTKSVRGIGRGIIKRIERGGCQPTTNLYEFLNQPDDSSQSSSSSFSDRPTSKRSKEIIGGKIAKRPRGCPRKILTTIPEKSEDHSGNMNE